MLEVQVSHNHQHHHNLYQAVVEVARVVLVRLELLMLQEEVLEETGYSLILLEQIIIGEQVVVEERILLMQVMVVLEVVEQDRLEEHYSMELLEQTHIVMLLIL
jgi:hypothetical protein